MVNTQSDIYIGVDIGKTKILVGVIDLSNGLLLDKIEGISQGKLWNEILDCTLFLIDDMIAKYDVKGIGVGIFGITDFQAGYMISCGFMDFDNCPIYDILRNRYSPLSIFVDNDVNVAVAGEYYYHFCGRDITLITAGTSIGVASVINGSIFRGNNYLSGEIAHLSFNGTTFSETCGGFGISEKMFNLTGKHIPTEDVLDLAFSKLDNDAIDIANDAVKSLTNIIFIIQNTIDPKQIVLGGSLLIKNEHLFESVCNEVKQKYPKNYLRAIPNGINITQAKLGLDSCIWGGAILCKQLIK